ncbi:hypothetical protein PMI15_04056 [Polaromonas sp. CF318]|nr:hypothetical protein PMI15_04056 [Polaromonas sp. CF318]
MVGISVPFDQTAEHQRSIYQLERLNVRSERGAKLIRHSTIEHPEIPG